MEGREEALGEAVGSNDQEEDDEMYSGVPFDHPHPLTCTSCPEMLMYVAMCLSHVMPCMFHYGRKLWARHACPCPAALLPARRSLHQACTDLSGHTGLMYTYSNTLSG